MTLKKKQIKEKLSWYIIIKCNRKHMNTKTLKKVKTANTYASTKKLKLLFFRFHKK